MDVLFCILTLVCLLGIYLALENKKLKKDMESLERSYADTIIERDTLRVRVEKAERNDYKINGRYAKRPE